MVRFDIPVQRGARLAQGLVLVLLPSGGQDRARANAAHAMTSAAGRSADRSAAHAALVAARDRVPRQPVPRRSGSGQPG